MFEFLGRLTNLLCDKEVKKIKMLTNFFGIPSDRTDLILLLGITLGLVLLTLLITIIQSIRKRPSVKLCAAVFIALLSILAYMVFSFKSSDVPSSAQIEAKKNLQSTVSVQDVDESVSFNEIYYAYKENELRADDVYQNNRYRITAKVNGMTTDGLFNLTGGATLTMEIQVDSITVFFYAEFERKQEEALKTINVGDTVTFEGKCLSAGTWVDCELITE